MKTNSGGSVIRVEKTNNYTVMSNQHFHCTNMSLKAKGLLSLILSLPDDWEYSISGLCSICKESYGTVKSTMDELKELGYLTVVKHNPNNKNGGRYTYEYIIYEQSNTPEKLEFKWKKNNC